MGDQNISEFTDFEDRTNFTRHLLEDIASLEEMIKSGLVESDIQRIGAEQEVVLLDKDWLPSMNYDKILAGVDDPLITTELARFNLELNLEPQLLVGDAFSKMHSQLDGLLEKAKSEAAKHDTKLLLTGILPTIHTAHLQGEHMTPFPRYSVLNEIIKGEKEGKFKVFIKGVDELNYEHNNILFEACNTSFQVHYQVSPEEFAMKHNWAQAIAGPVLAISANSPLLMGRRLWKETRIALFQQSIDTRNSAVIKRDIRPRVFFGDRWLKSSAIEIYRDNVSRFPSMFKGNVTESSKAQLKKGVTPHLEALKLHSGAIYSWNRCCYGISDNGKPHLRIENRYIPSGPTTIDEMANSAFWVGLMHGMPEKYANINEQLNFEDVKFNFFNAARVGMEANLRFNDKSTSVPKIILELLLPWAEDGLKKAQVNDSDIKKYLGVIEERAEKAINGSSWMLKNFNQFLKKANNREASTSITRALYKNCWSNKPVHQWDSLKVELNDGHKHFYNAEQLMNQDIRVVKDHDIVELVLNIMDWSNERYVAVENDKHELIGLIASRMLLKKLKKGWHENQRVGDVMETELVTASPEDCTHDILKKMCKYNIGCIPVVIDGNRLVGIITERDILKATHLTKKFKREK